MSMFNEIDPEDSLEGLLVNDKHRAVRWDHEGEGEIQFSWTQKGDAIMVHFQTDGKGLRNLRKVCDEFCEWIFHKFGWCDMLITNVTPDKQSIARMVEKIGWKKLLDHDGGTAYARMRSWADLEQQ
jgi:hypothetical protein